MDYVYFSIGDYIFTGKKGDDTIFTHGEITDSYNATYFATKLCITSIENLYNETIKYDLIQLYNDEMLVCQCKVGDYIFNMKCYLTKKRAFYSSDKILIDEKYRGEFIGYFENGVENVKGHIMIGRPCGIWTYRNEKNKIIMIIDKYVNSLIDGKVYKYFDDGTFSSTTYENGYINGVYAEYYGSGMIKTRYKYFFNVLTCEPIIDGYYISYYDPNIYTKHMLHNNTRAQMDNICEEGHYSMGHRIGEWKKWYRNGNLETKGIYKQSMLDGQLLLYKPNGRLEFSIQMSNGYINERNFISFYLRDECGKIKMICEYLHGKRHGTWIEFHDGVKLNEKKYKFGELIETINYLNFQN